MFVNLLRISIVYLIVLALVRLMGKRQIGEMQPFELVITLIFADIATIPMTDNSIPLLTGIIPIITLVFLQYFLSLISRKSLILQNIINGKPVIVIDPNGINYKNLQALNMSITDLQEALRGCSVANFDEVQYAIIETTGKLSVILKKANSPLTCQDLGLKQKENTFPLILIDDGRVINKNLELSELSLEDINNIIKKHGIKSVKELIIMNIDNNGKIYLQSKKGNATSFIIDYNGGNKW